MHRFKLAPWQLLAGGVVLGVYLVLKMMGAV
jgi:hypothetical protein